MLTDYMVTCPNECCHWHGGLLPEERNVWQGAVCTTRVVTFVCPECHCEWHAEVVGDDVKPLHETEHVSV